MAVQAVAVCCSTLEGDMSAVCSHVFDVLFLSCPAGPGSFARIRGVFCSAYLEHDAWPVTKSIAQKRGKFRLSG